MFDDFFAKASELRQQGIPFATAIVVRSEAPSSAKPGDKAIVTLDGVMTGWIGGSCAQPTVIEEALRAMADGQSRLLRLTPEQSTQPTAADVAVDMAVDMAAGIEERPMTCYSGGALEIYIEPQEPQPRLLIVGHLPTAQALAHLGRAMSYHVIACDPETKGAAMAHADEILTRLDELGSRINPVTYVVVATHGGYDEEAVELALRSSAPYVGLVASRKRGGAIRSALEKRGLRSERLDRLRVPAGLDIGSRRGDEIALSIIAEIVRARRSAEGVKQGAAIKLASDGRMTTGATAVAIDPVCGMAVDTTSKQPYEYRGELYYFCCGGCRARFAVEPERYLASSRAAE